MTIIMEIHDISLLLCEWHHSTLCIGSGGFVHLGLWQHFSEQVSHEECDYLCFK